MGITLTAARDGALAHLRPVVHDGGRDGHASSSAAPVHLDKLSISPSFLPLLMRKFGGSATLRAGDGSATVKGAFKQTRA